MKISTKQRIVPNLWFDNEAEDASSYYVSIFKDGPIQEGESKIEDASYFGKAGAEVSGKPEGSVMTVPFMILGQRFLALNGGPEFKFSEAISFIIECENQNEIDYYWEKLTQGGDEKSQICGWLKDKYGLSWQVVPKQLDEMLSDPDKEKVNKTMKVFLQMKKINIKELEEAYNG